MRAGVEIINQRTELVPVDSLQAHPRNVNRGDLGAIHASLDAHGFYGTIVAQESTGRVLAGNHRLLAMKQAGASEIPVTFVDVDDETALRILLVDNKTTRDGYADSNALAELLQELAATPSGLSGSGYDGDALDELLADLGAGQPELRGDPDAVPEVPEDQEPITKRGDIIRLGRHTLGCLDSTDADEVAGLLDGALPDMAWNDPPYGIAFDPMKERGGPFRGVKRGEGPIIPSIPRPPTIGDDSVWTAIGGYSVCAALRIPAVIFWGANHYASHLPDSPAWIVWDKDNTGDFADVELAWTNTGGAARLFRHTWNGMVKASERGERRIHAAQKPVALAEWCFAQYGKEGDVVLDLFGGSGTALIAAERTGRTCYIAELSGHYCDCICERFRTLTGIEPVREPATASAEASDHARKPTRA